MEKLSLLVAVFICNIAFAQTFGYTSGEEIKVRKEPSSLQIITADKTGLYYTDGRITVNGIPGINHYQEFGKLYKFDKNFMQVFEQDYIKQLKGYTFRGFQAIGEDIFLFASQYDKKNNKCTVYGNKLNKTTGVMTGGLVEITEFPVNFRNDDFKLKLSPVRSSDNILLVVTMENEQDITMGVALLDKNLKKSSKALITFPYGSKEFSIQDVLFTKNEQIVVLGKMSENIQVGRKRRKSWVFKEYLINVFSKTGARLARIPVSMKDHFAISGNIVEQQDGNLLLTGFYSNNAKKTDLHGFFVTKLDTKTNQLLSSSVKEINAGMLAKQNDEDLNPDLDDDDQPKSKNDKKKKDDDDDDDEMSAEYRIRSILTDSSTGNVVILSEIFKKRYRSGSRSSVVSPTGQTSTMTYKYYSDDILLISLDKEGNVKWLNSIPKKQYEEYNDDGYSYFGDYFTDAGGIPYYSSFTSLLSNGKLFIIMNDHNSNNVNVAYGDKVKQISNFKKSSSVYGITVDLANGTTKRKLILQNGADGILMPKYAYINENNVYLPSLRPKRNSRNGELKFYRITVQ